MSILRVSAVAFLIVMLGMVALTAICELMRRIGRNVAPAVDGDALDPAIVAVIAAAAAEALGRPVAIHRIHPRPPAETDRWSRAGRMDIMVSHRIGRSR